MERIKNKQYYQTKLEKIRMLESKSYQEIEIAQQDYDHKKKFYQEQKDIIGVKIRMLEVYQNLWEDVESQIGGQGFLNEEFWNNITFNMLKYNKFVQELNEVDYNKKIKNALDKKVNEELWEQRQQTFLIMKNDINHMYSNFNQMHSEMHKRSLLQRECIEKHISLIMNKCQEIEAEKEIYRSVFHEIRKDIGVKGNKFSRQALENYKASILEEIEYAKIEFNRVDLELAW